MKELYRFTLNKEVTKEETTTAEDGTKTITPVKAEEPVTFILKRPSRREREQAQLFYGDIFRELSAPLTQDGKPKKHLLTRTQLMRQYNDSGGPFSEQDRQYITTVRDAAKSKHDEYLSLVATEGEAAAIKKVEDEWRDLQRELVRLEQDYNSLFSSCADTIADQKTVLYMILFFTYLEKDGAAVPFFAGADFEDKLAAYDEFEEQEDKFNRTLLEKLSLYFTLIYQGVIDKKEDFELYEKEFLAT